MAQRRCDEGAPCPHSALSDAGGNQDCVGGTQPLACMEPKGCVQQDRAPQSGVRVVIPSTVGLELS
jgi:hypothetical protein